MIRAEGSTRFLVDLLPESQYCGKDLRVAFFLVSLPARSAYPPPNLLRCATGISAFRQASRLPPHICHSVRALVPKALPLRELRSPAIVQALHGLLLLLQLLQMVLRAFRQRVEPRGRHMGRDMALCHHAAEVCRVLLKTGGQHCRSHPYRLGTWGEGRDELWRLQTLIRRPVVVSPSADMHHRAEEIRGACERC
jgi:hypothetical protein